MNTTPINQRLWNDKRRAGYTHTMEDGTPAILANKGGATVLVPVEIVPDDAPDYRSAATASTEARAFEVASLLRQSYGRALVAQLGRGGYNNYAIRVPLEAA